MSKRAEEAALKAYLYNRAYTDNDVEYDGNFCNRLPYIEGYEQAEQDLGWISVKDELPKSDGYYFTCSNDNGHAQCVGVTEFDSATCQWLDDDDDGYINVDYWMEVPQLKENNYGM